MRREIKGLNAAELLLLGGAIGFLVGVAVGMIFLGLAYPMLQLDNMAAWFQAIGSMGAIVAAIWLFFAGARQRETERLIEQSEHVFSLMRTIELFASSLIFTVVEGGEGAKYFEKEREAQSLLASGRCNVELLINVKLPLTHQTLNIDLNEYCSRKGELLSNVFDLLKTIDWTKYPVSLIGEEIVSIMNDVYFFHKVLVDESEDIDSKEKMLRKRASQINGSIHSAIGVLDKAFGYESEWAYDKELRWGEPKKAIK